MSERLKRAGGRIGPVGGVPTLMAGQTPLPAPVFCLMWDQAMRTEVVASLHRAGIGAFAVRTMMGVGDCPQTDATIDLAVARMVSVARAAPSAWLMVDCDFFPSEQWMIDNPHEGFITADSRILVLGKDGMSDRREYLQVPGPSIKDVKGSTVHGEDARILYGRRRVSPFSERFAREAQATVGKLLAALREKGLERRLWGVFVGCYIFGEWNLYMTAPDQCRAAVRAVREYLRRQYGSTRALRTAWSDPFATLKTVRPPREYGQMNVPPLKLENQRQTDYQGAEAHALAEQFSIMARGIKQLDPRLAVGGFFPGANPPQSDWLRLIRDPTVDFLATPICYENRGPGCGVGSQSPFCDGFRAMGKVWFDELDTRTLRADKSENYRFGRARTLRESVDLLWRDAGQMLIRGHHGWWLDFGCNGKAPYSWHLDTEVLAFHSRFAAIWRQVGRLDRRPLEEIKVFIPAAAARHFQILHHADCQRHVEWTLLGAPVECEVLENLLDGQANPGKLNVIYGAACLEAVQLRLLQSRLRASRSFVVWMGGAGLCEPGRPIDPCRTEGVLPIRQEYALMDEPLELEACATPEAEAWLKLPAGALMGQYDRLLTSGFVKGPDQLNVPMKRVAVRGKLTVVDPDAVPLARLASDGSVLAAMKRDAGGVTHIVYNLPVLNTRLFRALAQQAGCHLFTKRDDVVFASKGLVLLHAAYTGTHDLFFSRAARICDLRSNTRVRTRAGRLTLQLKRGETRLYQWD